MTAADRRSPVVVLVAERQERRARAVLTGLEEEGVRADVVVMGGGSPEALAGDAAARATFDVGVGVDADGAVALRHSRLPAEHLAGALPDADEGRLRDLGHDAGRLVRRLPLRHTSSGARWPHPIATTPGKREDR